LLAGTPDIGKPIGKRSGKKNANFRGGGDLKIMLRVKRGGGLNADGREPLGFGKQPCRPKEKKKRWEEKGRTGAVFELKRVQSLRGGKWGGHRFVTMKEKRGVGGGHTPSTCAKTACRRHSR